MLKKVDEFYFDPSEVVAGVPERLAGNYMGHRIYLRGGGNFYVSRENVALQIIKEVLNYTAADQLKRSEK